MATSPYNDINPNTYGYVQGTVRFSRLTRYQTDNEIVEEAGRRGMKQSEVKHCYAISLNNARAVLPPNMASDVQACAMRDVIAHEIANQKNPKNAGWWISPSNFANFGGIYAVNDEGKYAPVELVDGHLTRELANGLNVTVVMETFKYEHKMGSGVSATPRFILINEPIRYYESAASASTAELEAALGVTFDKTPIQAPEPLAPTTQTTQVATAPQQVATQPQMPTQNTYAQPQQASPAQDDPRRMFMPNPFTFETAQAEAPQPQLPIQIPYDPNGTKGIIDDSQMFN